MSLIQPTQKVHFHLLCTSIDWIAGSTLNKFVIIISLWVHPQWLFQGGRKQSNIREKVEYHWFAMTLWWGNTFLFCSYKQLPRLRLGPLKGFLSWHGAVQGPWNCLVCCVQNYRESRTMSGVSHWGWKSPFRRTLSRTTETKTCASRKRTCFRCSKYWGPSPPPLPLPLTLYFPGLFCNCNPFTTSHF